MAEENEVPLQVQAQREEQNIKVSKRWLEALESSTFHGRYARDIADLVGYLNMEHDAGKKRLEAIVAKLKMPMAEFGIKKDAVLVKQ